MRDAHVHSRRKISHFDQSAHLAERKQFLEALEPSGRWVDDDGELPKFRQACIYKQV
jgi:hypothetical protein